MLKQCFFHRIAGFFLVEASTTPTGLTGAPPVLMNIKQMGALRIFLLTCVMQAFGTTLYLLSLDTPPLQAIAVSLALLAGFAGSLHAVNYRPKLASWLLIWLLYANGLFLLNALPTPRLAWLGLLYLYVTPLFTLFLFDFKTAIALMCLNVVPFILHLQDLPFSLAYIHVTAFGFFNIGMSLALSCIHPSSTQQEVSDLDVLTGLPTRLHFIDVLRGKISKANKNRSSLAILNIKIRDVHIVNERYGVHSGDKMITQLGRSIKAKLGQKDRIGRTRGCGLSVILTGPFLNPEDMRQQVLQYVRGLPRQIMIDDYVVDASYYIGCATYPQDANNAESLISASEIAQHQARQDKTNSVVFYVPEQATCAHRRTDLEAGLKHALRTRSLKVIYQPKVNHIGNLCGLEALVRWRSEELGQVSPAEFIPVAENAGLVHDVTLQVIESVTLQIKHWLDKGIPVCPVSVNLSAHDIAVPTLVEEIIAHTQSTYLPIDMLEFEITETALLAKGEVGIKNLTRLRDLGFRISIDDFGSGYSSLSQMANLPIYSIKIDREFVRDVPGDPRREKIIDGIISLAHSLNLTVVAEGVEDLRQVDFLRVRGCELYQGYHFHRPMNAVNIEHLLKTLQIVIPETGTSTLAT